MNAYAELRLLTAALGSGETRSGEVCPFCRGGRTGEKSLGLWQMQSGSVGYRCHRAQCGRSGRIDGGASYGLHHQESNRPKDFEPRLFRGIIEEVPDVIFEYYTGKYGFSETALRATGFRWAPEYNRTVWEVRSPTGTIRGYELRSHRDEDRPKTIHYRHKADAWAGYVGLRGGREQVWDDVGGGGHSGRNQTLILVEDLISAHKVSQVYPACSIMGSHLNIELIVDITRVNDERLILCLDKDATQKAIGFQRRYAFLCPNLRVVPLERDLKYECPEKIREIIG